MASGNSRRARSAMFVQDDSAPHFGSAFAGEAQLPLRDIARSALVALAYFLAARLGEALVFPSTPVSAFWAPNAILLAALVLTPPRRWWILMLVVLPAHLLAQAPYFPASQVAIQYLVNWGVALIGATALLKLAPEPTHFGRLRTVTVLILFGGILGPLVTSLLMSSAFALIGLNGDIWLTTLARTVTNLFAVVTLVPLIVVVVKRDEMVLRHASPRHAVEAMALLGALVLTGVLVFLWIRPTPYESPLLLYAPMPLLLWAAVRFGVPGNCAAVLVLGALSTWGVLQGSGPFTSDMPVVNALSLIMYLVVTCVPLLLLAALIEERRLQANAARSADTERQLAEHEASEQRQQLAHLSRAAVLGELSGSFAHELNQPLTSILGNAEAALRLLSREPQDVDGVRECLTDIVDDDVRAAEMIQRLRALLRRGDMLCQPTNVNEIVHEVLDLGHSELIARHISAVADLDPGLPTVMADKIQLQQVLLNLVVNACEAMSDSDPGNRTLTIRTRRARSTPEIEVAVVDRGIGIAPADLERIFQPFITTKPRGLDLGLGICRSIVDAHHGRLWAESSGMGGATFRFTLPVTPIRQ